MTKNLSKAQRFFLSRFGSPYPVDAMTRDTRWPEKLGHSVVDEIATLKAAGLLKVAVFTPIEALESLSGAELQKLAKAGSIPYSGKKSVVAARIIEKLPQVAQRVTDSANASGKVVCTDAGRRIAADYLAEIATEKSAVQTQMIETLKKGRYLETVVLHHKFDDEQVFQQGMFISTGEGGSQKREVNEKDRDVQIVRTIYETKPSIIADIPDSAMPTLRLAAAMTFLWGTGRPKAWIPDGFTVTHRLEIGIIINMVYFHAIHKFNIADHKRIGFTKATISSTADSCDYCKSFAKKTFLLDSFPELPHAECTSSAGCRCIELVETSSYRR